MKCSIYTLILFILIAVNTKAFAQTTYKITANSPWSASIPTSCIDCAITISPNAILTIDKNTTCMNCTFIGGAMVMTNETLSLLYANTQTTTLFTNTSLTVNGDNGKVIVNAPLSLTNTTFTFNNGAALTTSYEVDLTASTINLFDRSTMVSTGGSSTKISLMSNSHIVVGNGSQTSTSNLLISGPSLVDYDNSSVTLGNLNNIYYNWAGYTYDPSVNSNSHAAKAYSTQNNTISCGTGYSHSCTNPLVYGPSTIGSVGLVPGNTLPIVLVAFNAVLDNDKTITLNWNTAQEVNSSHITIQRSADGNSWEDIGAVKAKGNSAIETAYTYTDEHPLSGNNLYRLQLVDLDNSFAYSEVKVVRTSTIGAISFYPNPARDYVNVSLGNALSTNEAVTVRLISLSGQLMQEQHTTAAAGTVITFRIANYASGMYILSVIGQDGTKETRQLMITTK